MSERSDSILSHGERDVARYLRDDPDAVPAGIAEARDVTEAEVRKAVDRVREKTRRALATLAESPFTEECAAELDPRTRRDLAERLRAEE